MKSSDSADVDVSTLIPATGSTLIEPEAVILDVWLYLF